MNGIPSLVILDGETGEVINADGRDAVGSDPEFVEFPWKPKSVSEVTPGGKDRESDGHLHDPYVWSS